MLCSEPAGSELSNFKAINLVKVTIGDSWSVGDLRHWLFHWPDWPLTIRIYYIQNIKGGRGVWGRAILSFTFHSTTLRSHTETLLIPCWDLHQQSISFQVFIQIFSRNLFTHSITLAFAIWSKPKIMCRPCSCARGLAGTVSYLQRKLARKITKTRQLWYYPTKLNSQF